MGAARTDGQYNGTDWLSPFSVANHPESFCHPVAYMDYRREPNLPNCSVYTCHASLCFKHRNKKNQSVVSPISTDIYKRTANPYMYCMCMYVEVLQ